MKTLLYGGHVIDPKNRIDSRLNVLLENGKIAWLGREYPDADREFDVTGKIVAPGFLDIHMHEDPVVNGHIQPSIFPMMLSMGVTTAVGGNCGINVYDPAQYLDLVDREGAPVNVALFAGHEYFRKAAGATDIYAGSTAEQLGIMEQGLEQALDAGCVGISFGLRYVPGADAGEFYRAAKPCQSRHKMIASHVRDDADGIFDAVEEVCRAGFAYRIPVQISHIGSMGGFGQMERLLCQLDDYRANGLDVAADCYPYFAFSTRLGTPTYDEGWLERYHCGYEVLEFCEGPYKGQRATAETFAQMRQEFPECITVCHVMRPEEIRMALHHPNVMAASDGLMDNGQGHPRAAGTFPRFLKEFCREGSLSLFDAVEKITALPAARLGLTQKGCLSVGADADVTVFDFDAICDKATFAQPGLPPEGIEYVFVRGEPALEKGKILRRNLGRALRI